MQTTLVKFDKHRDCWDIGFEIALTDEELSLVHMDTVKHIEGCKYKLKDNILFFNYIFLKKELKKNETIFERFGHIQNCIEHIAASCVD